MKKIYKVAIIGCGASGLLSAIELTSGENSINGKDIILLEKNDRVGKKIIATGNGQGNLTNVNLSASNYYGEPNLINTFFKENFLNLRQYFYKLNIPTTAENNGKVYPLSMQASSFLDILRIKLDKENIQTALNEKVINISFSDGCFTILTEKDNKYYAENVIISVGGKAQKQFGTDGTSYALAEKFGHKITKLYPSLVQLKTETEKIKGFKGLRERVSVSLFDGDKFVRKETGDIIFTEYGVSGDSIFKISASVQALKNPLIKIEFLPDLTMEEISKIISDRNMAEETYLGLINKRIGQSIAKSVKDKSPTGYSKAIKNFYLTVKGTLGFDNAQVTKGGIDTDDVNPYSMQSKIQKGLYFAGEVLNVDGDCGGYNLTFAFLSGIAVAKNIKDNQKIKMGE
ncbi:MAG: aminoacetone oxidase family FAD-binding enzyme [Clostridia bacterium]|nr:aminoacetone oxidase family FAD-binding enzyme [Clostridia bacterium]